MEGFGAHHAICILRNPKNIGNYLGPHNIGADRVGMDRHGVHSRHVQSRSQNSFLLTSFP